MQGRHNDLLKILLYEESWITGDRLACKLKVTTRTLRNDINTVNRSIVACGASVKASKQKGYKLICDDFAQLEALVFERGCSYDSPEKRIRNIGILLLQTDETHPQQIDDLAESMFVSNSTFESDLKKIKETLESRATPVKIHRKNNKVWSSADESTRRFLLREMILDRTDESYIYADNYYMFFGKSDTDTAIRCLRNICAEFALSLSDGDIIHLVIYLCIKIKRIREGFVLSEHPAKMPDDAEEETSLATLLSNNVEREFAVGLSHRERVDTARQLSLLGIDPLTDEQHVSCAQEQKKYCVQIVDALLEDIMNKYLIDLRSDHELRSSLISHISRTIGKTLNFTKTTNPILMLLKNDYPFVFEMSLYLYDRIKEVFDIKLSEDELGYVSSYLGAAIKRLEDAAGAEKSKLSVISNNDTATNKLLMARLISLYGNKYDIKGPYSFFDAERAKEENSSFIIATGPLARLHDKSIPAIHISPALNDSDIGNINRKLSAINKQNAEVNLPNDRRLYFSEEAFHLHPPVNTKEDVIQYISDKLCAKGYVPENFANKTLERECVHPTVFGRNMAMPHPIDACALKTVIAVTVLKEPLMWNPGTVQLVFLLAIKKDDTKYLNHFFDITVKLVDESQKVTKLIGSSSYGEFISLLFD
ncbi:MAG: PTS sugar transporter subunit IIA [Clostridiales Family XIII bacterium]|nr:PTS sugar transporter subunit IIA [Clostridiales Family XIII bacterium]